MALFETEWLGGTAERLFAKHRGDRLEEIQWSALQTNHLPLQELDRLRTVWTQSAHQEWCAAGAFTALLQQLLLARAPVDLIGMAGRFVADEMLHVELASRMAMAYGGGVALDVDYDRAIPFVDEGSALLRACALAIRVSCVGESFSLPVIAHEYWSATDPVARSVLGRIAADEGPHARVGWLVLDWAAPRLSKADLAYLGTIADDAVSALRPALEAAAEQRPFYDRILATKVVVPLSDRGIRLAA
jgi:hypothetical protein